jgi:predicted metal-dependent hydrolase
MKISLPQLVTPDQTSLEVTLKWSTRRKTIGLMVTTAGDLVVAAPVGTRPETIRQAIGTHQGWIVRKLSERREAMSRIEIGKAYYLGQAYPVRLVRNAQPPVQVAGAEIHLGRPGGGVKWVELLEDWYPQEAGRLLTDRVRHFIHLMKLKVGRIEVRDWRRRWGECRPREGLLRFNWRLVLLPLGIVDYVVAHELTHLAVPGHPPRFWRRLAKVMPDWEARRRWLNRYGLPFLLWKMEKVAPEAGAGGESPVKAQLICGKSAAPRE